MNNVLLTCGKCCKDIERQSDQLVLYTDDYNRAVWISYPCEELGKICTRPYMYKDRLVRDKLVGAGVVSVTIDRSSREIAQQFGPITDAELKQPVPEDVSSLL